MPVPARPISAVLAFGFELFAPHCMNAVIWTSQYVTKRIGGPIPTVVGRFTRWKQVSPLPSHHSFPRSGCSSVRLGAALARSFGWNAFILFVVYIITPSRRPVHFFLCVGIVLHFPNSQSRTTTNESIWPNQRWSRLQSTSRTLRTWTEKCTTFALYRTQLLFLYAPYSSFSGFMLTTRCPRNF
jgi:hypothetical protein